MEINELIAGWTMLIVLLSYLRAFGLSEFAALFFQVVVFVFHLKSRVNSFHMSACFSDCYYRRTGGT